MKKASQFILDNWRELSITTVFGVAAAALYTSDLSGLTYGRLSALESAIPLTQTAHGLFTNPWYFLYELLQLLLHTVHSVSTIDIVRVPSALLSIAAVICFMMVLMEWHSLKTAILGGSLFVTNAWVLHSARIQGYSALYLFSMSLLLLSLVMLRRYSGTWWVIVLCGLCCSAVLTTPFGVELVGFGLVMQRKDLVKAFHAAPALYKRALLILSSLLWLLPAIYGWIAGQASITEFFGLPKAIPSVSVIAKNAMHVPETLFLRGPFTPATWLGRLPALDILTSACVALGLYFYCKNWRAGRTRLIGGLLLLCLIGISLGGPVEFSIILPVVFLIAAAGLGYLLNTWLKVFPYNPIARSIGIGLIGIIVLLSVTYNIRSYFIAWRYAPQTIDSFDVAPLHKLQ